MYSKHPLYRRKYLRQLTIEQKILYELELDKRIIAEQGKVESYTLSPEELSKYTTQK